MTSNGADEETFVQRASRLEQELQHARAELAHLQSERPLSPSLTPASASHLHSLLLIADSALPLGSFAFSAGLESFLAHRPKQLHTTSTFQHFLDISLHSLASATIPYVVTAYENPYALEELDNDLDASTNCTVARRSSIAQGRALVGVWERSFRTQTLSSTSAVAALEGFIELSKSTLRNNGSNNTIFQLNIHFPPLFGAVSAALSIPIQHVLYVYLLNHAKLLLSAAVRASIIGPYQGQGVLASAKLREKIFDLVGQELKLRRTTADTGQSVPMMDLWGGRHEIVYSRIFNS